MKLENINDIIKKVMSKVDKTPQWINNLIYFTIGFIYAYVVLGLSYRFFIGLHHSSSHAENYALLTLCVLTAIIVLIKFEQKRTS